MTITHEPHVQKMFLLEVEQDNTNKHASNAHNITDLMRAVGLVLPGVRPIILEQWSRRVAADQTKPLGHAAVNQLMDERARKAAQDYGNPEDSLPILDWWRSHSAIEEAGEHVAFSRERLSPAQVWLYHDAAYWLNQHLGPAAFNVFINFDDMAAPENPYSVIGTGPGRGTLEKPDWEPLHHLGSYAMFSFDRALAQGKGSLDALHRTLANMETIVPLQSWYNR